jgi:rubredoxin
MTDDNTAGGLGPIGPLHRATEDTWRHRNRLSCPACGYQFDAASSQADEARAPADGDFSVCFACGEVMVFAASAFGLAVREASTEELAEFSRSPENVETVRSIHRFRAGEGRGRPGGAA